jgi:hypothetical protein
MLKEFRITCRWSKGHVQADGCAMQMNELLRIRPTTVRVVITLV